MTSLYSYVIPVDDGAAPNPYWGICSLAICKPRIRSTAEVGDWVVGTGSKKSPIGDIHDKVVYAMYVTQVMTMQEYDEYTRTYLVDKIPNRRSKDRRKWLGDSIYDFTSNPPRLRESVHTKENMKRDLGGENVLLSKEFFYFGDKPQKLPKKLMPIVREGQGHKSSSNAELLPDFLEWLYGLHYRHCGLIGKPQMDAFKDEETRIRCASICIKE